MACPPGTFLYSIHFVCITGPARTYLDGSHRELLCNEASELQIHPNSQAPVPRFYNCFDFAQNILRVRLCPPGGLVDTYGTGSSKRSRANGHTHRAHRTRVSGGSSGTSRSAGTVLSRVSNFSSLTLALRIFSMLFNFSAFGLRNI